MKRVVHAEIEQNEDRSGFAITIKIHRIETMKGVTVMDSDL